MGVCAAIVFPSREGRGDDENLDADAPDFKWQKGNLIGKGAVGSVYLGMVQGAQATSQRAGPRWEWGGVEESPHSHFCNSHIILECVIDHIDCTVWHVSRNHFILWHSV